jgi:hypothetical protein
MPVRFAPANAGLFDPECVVFEEDTHRVLSARTEQLPTVTEHPVRVTHRAHDADPLPPGTLWVRKGTEPVEIDAIVCDLDRLESTQRVEWVRQAWQALFAQGHQRMVAPLLGTVHTGLSPDEALQALARAQPPEDLDLWILGDRSLAGVWRALSEPRD